MATNTPKSIEEKYEYTTARESVLYKDWAAGSRTLISTNECVITKGVTGYNGSIKEVKYAPAWLKIIDEPIVNALDHFIRCYSGSNPVTTVKVAFDKPSGRIKIYNNGLGIEIAVHKIASEHLGRQVYVPEALFGELFQGSNRTRQDDSIIGGTNGLGAKLSNIFSDDFIIETIDTERKLYYLQRWKDNMVVRENPVVVDLTKPNNLGPDRVQPHTVLSFLPSYKHFGYSAYDASVYDSLIDIVRTRVMFASAYITYTNSVYPKKPSTDVYFNDEKINTSLSAIASWIHPDAQLVKTIVTPTVAKQSHFTHPWEVIAAIMPTRDEVQTHVSIVNGIVVKDGKHIKKILDQIIEGVKEKIAKVFKDKKMNIKPSYITGSLVLFINAKIPNPSWTGQRKDILDIDIRKLAGYILDKKFLDAVSDKLKDQIVEDILNEKPKVAPKDKFTLPASKYQPARILGSKSTLLLAEGDSAFGQIQTGITKNRQTLGTDYYGIMCLGGVITNVRRECIITEGSDGQRRIKPSTKLEKNIFVNAFLGVTGLSLHCRYDPKSPTYKKEMRDLNYGTITACVDQDYDGIGNIFGLILNMFEVFWPNLIDAGFLRRFDTPQRRAYPKTKGTVVEFYNDDQYDHWEADLKSQGKTVDAWTIKYYKGYASHSEAEIIHMFKNFHRHLYVYYLDEKSPGLFEIYYDDNAKLRKIELATPTIVPSKEKVAEQFRTKRISCSDHLSYETKTYQKDNIERHLDHAIDGLNQSGRMIIDGSVKAFKQSNAEMKVAQLAGYVALHETYHHGEASMAESIKGRAFTGVGGKQLPLLIPIGDFGSRLKGGGGGAPRYVHTKLNKKLANLIYPEDDYHILEFTFDENKRGAPTYFIPIIPTAILESNYQPGHGWAIKVWARDAIKVIDNVRRLIKIGENAPLLTSPPFLGGWNGKIQSIRGEPYSFGNYTYDAVANTVIITELPLRVWTNDYLEMLEKKRDDEAHYSIIESFHNQSDSTNINITITLKPNAYKWLEEHGWGDSIYTDPFEEYFQLRDHMNSNLNFIGSRGEVIEFKNYEDIIRYWFPFRRALYSERINRELILLRLEKLCIEEIIRYSKIAKSLAGLPVAEMIKRISENEPAFAKINNTLRKSPGFTPTAVLRDTILNGPDASYDYLLDLSDRAKSLEAIVKNQEYIEKLDAKIAAVELAIATDVFPGASVWLAELDKLEKVIKVGRDTNWEFDDHGKFTFE